ncbi:hypothetical protein ABZ499_30090 [Streptomyces sp. NPDC019990]|uniref:hypothetical protein n=1 Tax=Streptomyces sp. NPDC019990 TaxID=3154693 RepID=UPI0033D5A260
MSVIAGLERDVAGCVQDYANGSQEALADGLSAVIRARVFPRLVRDIMSDEARFAEMARRSVWHPNGFAKIVLLAAPDYRLRLHAWRGAAVAAPEVQENVHNHRWDFATTIVAGAYWHQEFRAAEDGDAFFGYRYVAAGDRRSYRLTPVGARALRRVFAARLPQGARYTMSSEVLHKVVPDFTEPAVSLVLEGPHRPTEVDVYAENELGLAPVVPFVPLTAQVLAHQLAAVASLPHLC